MNKNMIRQAQQLQQRMAKVQEELESATVEASSGGGMVNVVVSGALRVLSVEIEPSLIKGDDRTMIQDLVAAAINAALAKAQETVAQEMARMQQSMLAGLPGMPGGLV